MPLFHDPQPAPDLKLKIELKRWERSFVKINGRKPKKEDIEAAGEDVSLMYTKYWAVVRGHPLPSLPQCKKRHHKETRPAAPVSPVTAPPEQAGDSSSRMPSSLPSGVWGENLLKRNFNPHPDLKSAENPAVQPFLTRLRKLHLKKEYVQTSLVRGLFSLKRRKKSDPRSPPDQADSIDGDSSQLTSETAASTMSPGALMTPVCPDESAASNILNSIYNTDISPSSGVSSFSGSSFKENECSNQSFAQPPSSSTASIKLFDDEEDSAEFEIEKVKETYAEQLNEVVFEGCELLPMDFKRKKHKAKNPPTAKALKKRNENYTKINIKKKSFASKGYKKIDVAKEKRKAHYKLKRNRCFTCGESGHWRHECPLLNKPPAKSCPSTDAQPAPAEPDAGEAEELAAHPDDVPFLPEDHIICSEEEDGI